MKNNFLKEEIDIENASKRIDIFISELVPEFSRSRVQNLIKNGDVLINEEETKSAYKLKEGDILTINFPDAKPLELKAEDIPLDIVFENDFMLVVNKPSGMLTHPTSMDSEGTLVNALLHHSKNSLSGINGIMRPGIVHRLDKDTSGLLMVAKNDFAHLHLSKQIKEKTAIRKYLTIVHGVINEDEGTITAPIGRHKSQKCKMAVDFEKGKPAISHFKVLERFKNFTFLEVTLQTGRTHQIRVHFSNIHHPVYGDTLYGGGNVKVKTNGQVLQSYKLSFANPENEERLEFEIEKEEELQKVLNYLRVQNK